MKQLKYLLFTIIIFLGCNFCLGQEIVEEEEAPEQVRPFRIGIKIGNPNIVGANLEYVTPWLNRRLSVNLDYSKIQSGWFTDEIENDEAAYDLDFDYIGAGINYYFFRPGKGVYGSITYGSMHFNGRIWQIESETGPQQNGRANVSYSHNTVNLKIGGLWGNRFYFRPEIGYILNPLPKTVNLDVYFNDGHYENQDYRIFSNEDSNILKTLYSGLIFNIGFGYSF